MIGMFQMRLLTFVQYAQVVFVTITHYGFVPDVVKTCSQIRSLSLEHSMPRAIRRDVRRSGLVESA